MVEVTVEDWDAAQVYADLYSGSECYKPGYHQRIGEAFARHRTAAEQRGKLEGARLAIEDAADYVAYWAAHNWPTSAEGETKAIVRCIRALSPTKIVGEG